MKTGYLGPQGTYSELAHDKVFKNTEKFQFANFYRLFKAVSDGEIDAGIVPLENALEGSVTQCLDLLFQSKDVFVTAQTYIKIEHRLMLKKGSKLEDIKTVFSHEQAIKQCGKFLSEKLGSVKLVYTDSTSASAAIISDESQACIVGSHMEKPGYVFYGTDIADTKGNETRFCVIQKGIESLAPSSSKVLISAGSENRPGALLELLTTLNNSRLNMTKIESRPLKTKMGEYVFFIEFEGDISDNNVKNTLEKLKNTATIFKLLGCYN